MNWNDLLKNTVDEPGTALLIFAALGLFLFAGFWISRRKIWLLPLLPLILCAGALLLADYWILSPREKVRCAIDECATAIETNQKSLLLDHLSPELAKQVKRTADQIFSMLEFSHASTNNVKLEENEFTSPPSIRAVLLVGVRFKSKGATIPAERWTGALTLTFEEFEGTWLIVDYETRPIFSNGATESDAEKYLRK